MTQADPTLPMLEAAPGMTLQSARDASSVPFRVPADDASPCVAQPPEPHRFTLQDAGRGFTMPGGRFSLREAHRGVIFRLRVTPQLAYLDVTPAVDLCVRLAETIEASRWLRRARTPETTLARRLRESGGDRAGEWLGDEWVAELWVRRALQRDTDAARMLGLAHDAYLTTLLIWDIRRVAAANG